MVGTHAAAQCLSESVEESGFLDHAIQKCLSIRTREMVIQKSLDEGLIGLRDRDLIISWRSGLVVFAGFNHDE